ncbi:chloride channel protein [Aestuariibacter halophilus]|uniref:Chloride channel protein n=1 Tax=Fluctibacter halophilus TaxID=226011 RepID=A0ABS8GAE3_9ALTE|nr:chloride channel protein [Aestuariibacter halophilus]MCC2617458.1 chloride channel protein [Aestuariibacter halophilus]
MSLRAFRQELANPRTSAQLCLLGIIGGVCAASLIIVFRIGVEYLQSLYVQGGADLSTTSPLFRLLLPFIGALLIIAFAFVTGFKHYRMGIPFVIHRVKVRYGHIPFRTTLNQFFGGMVALASGFVVGREGPSVHLGAAGSSFLGQWLKLPYNSIRILAGCGIAAGISASFNTPFAAVIFVMEVVLREYKIHIFIPVMLAAACGSVLTRIAFGEVHELSFLQFKDFNHWYYALLIPFGMMLGGVASLFNTQLMNIIRWFRPVKMVWRLLIAALVTGLIGMFLPEAMGSGFEEVHAVIQADGMQMLLIILAAKIVLTWIAIGLGIPGGVIGPVFVLGMLCGAVMIAPLQWFLPDVEAYTNSFALLGIAGLLTAVLHAPLAALSAVMELSYNPAVILPAMLVIVPAYVTSTQLLGNRSIFIRQLDYQKLSYSTSAVNESLQKTGVLAVMDSNFKMFDDAPERFILEFLEQAPTQAVVQRSRFEIDVTYALVQYDMSLGHDASPLHFSAMEGVPFQATLAEVYDILQASRDGGVYIYEGTPANIVGVVTWNSLRAYLHRAQY